MPPVLLSYALLLLKAAATTIWISWLALVAAGLIGGAVGTAWLSGSRALRVSCVAYVELFRSIPTILMMFFCFYGLPLLVGRDFSPFWAATVALTLEASALMATVVQASLRSVAQGQWDAAAALGLTAAQTFRLVVVPQAVRVALPPAVGVYIATLKDSSVASVIGYLELTKTGLLIRETSAYGYEALVGVSVLYFAINASISLGGAALERRFGAITP